MKRENEEGERKRDSEICTVSSFCRLTPRPMYHGVRAEMTCGSTRAVDDCRIVMLEASVSTLAPGPAVLLKASILFLQFSSRDTAVARSAIRTPATAEDRTWVAFDTFPGQITPKTSARNHKLSETGCQPASIALCSDHPSTFYQLDFRAIPAACILHLIMPSLSCPVDDIASTAP